MTSLRRLLTPRLGFSKKESKAAAPLRYRYEDSRVSMANSTGKTPAIFNTPMPYTMAF